MRAGWKVKRIRKYGNSCGKWKVRQMEWGGWEGETGEINYDDQACFTHLSPRPVSSEVLFSQEENKCKKPTDTLAMILVYRVPDQFIF